MRSSATENLADFDCAVIGAGVVGLAIARAVAMSGRSVVVLEAEATFGSGTSSRNSEVIHAGIYYPADSLKARYCVRGRELLYSYCESRGVPHRRIGKLVVATDEAESRHLQGIEAHARANGVDNLQALDRARINALEPQLNACAGLLSPDTGIVDTHSLMLALIGEAEDHGATIAYRSPLRSAIVGSWGLRLDIGGREPCSITSRFAVNAAGLMAADVAGRMEGLAGPPPRMKFAKGNYFGVNAKVPFGRLVYPVPEPGGLGVHLTFDLAHRPRFGPDVEWTDTLDYTVAASRALPFYRAIRRYWPGLPDDSLYPDYCGIRAKAGDAADFVVDRATGNVIGLFGIESPGLTSCLAIAEDVAAAVRASA